MFSGSYPELWPFSQFLCPWDKMRNGPYLGSGAKIDKNKTTFLSQILKVTPYNTHFFKESFCHCAIKNRMSAKKNWAHFFHFWPSYSNFLFLRKNQFFPENIFSLRKCEQFIQFSKYDQEFLPRWSLKIPMA